MLSILNESDFDITSGVCVVKFWATWCAPCKRLSPVLDKIEKEFESIKFLSVDVDQVPSIAQKHKVRMLPTILVFKNGREIKRINGLVLTEPLRKAFRDVVDKCA
jgi:thioredoxin 1